MNRQTNFIKRGFWIVLVLLAALILAACDDDDDKEEAPTATSVPTATATVAPTATKAPTATVAPTTEPTEAPTEEESTPEAVQVVHPEGTGACAAQQVTMGGTFTMCLTATCDVPLDSGPVQYEDKTDVGGCTEEGLIGICSTSAFDMYYYDGEPQSLQLGCGFMRGEWTLAGG